MREPLTAEQPSVIVTVALPIVIRVRGENYVSRDGTLTRVYKARAELDGRIIAGEFSIGYATYDAAVKFCREEIAAYVRYATDRSRKVTP